MRLVRFLVIIGATLVLLSYISPILAPAYSPYADLSPGVFEGFMIHCENGLDIRVSSEHNEPFSVYLMTYENGLKTFENGSLENVTIIQAFTNATSLNEHLSVPNPGWYALLVTPSTNETITFIEVDFGRQCPNQFVFLAGTSFLVVGTLWFLIKSRTQLLGLTSSLKRRKEY